MYCTHLLSSLPVLVQTLNRVISTLITPIVNPANSPVSKISTIANRPVVNHAEPVSVRGTLDEGVGVAAEGEVGVGRARSLVPRRTSELIHVGESPRAALMVRARWLMRGAEQRKPELMDKRSRAVNFCKHISVAVAPTSASAKVTFSGGRGYERAETRSKKRAAILMAMPRGHERKMNIDELSISMES